MNDLAIYDSFASQLHEQDITDLEHELDLKLPIDYKSFLLAHNGGFPEPSTFRILDFPDSEYGVVNRFFGIAPGQDDDLADMHKLFQERLPAELLPIADDPGGNLLCLSVSPKNAGRVYFWFHEAEVDEGEQPTYENIYFVADSFSDLLTSLMRYPDTKGS